MLTISEMRDSIFGDRIAETKYDLILLMQGMLKTYMNALLFINQTLDIHIIARSLVEKTNIELSRLNEILIMFTENKIIEYVGDNNKNRAGYIIGGHCGIVAYMLLAAIHILNKKYYATSQYIRNE